MCDGVVAAAVGQNALKLLGVPARYLPLLVVVLVVRRLVQDDLGDREAVRGRTQDESSARGVAFGRTRTLAAHPG